MEAAVVLDWDWTPLYFHTPAGRTGGSLPDSHDLWSVLWENRRHLLGVAHSHPGGGQPAPSHEDVTTFSAVERALGVRLLWPIATLDAVQAFHWEGPGSLQYARWGGQFTSEMLASWLPELLRRSA